MSVDHPKLATIRGLLAKAEATEFDGEREVFLAKAVELIARYGIDEALLAAKADVRQKPGTRQIRIEGSYGREKGQLLAWLIEALGGQAVLHQVQGRGRGSKSRTVAVTIIGFEADLDRAELLYTSLLVQALGQLGGVQGRARYWETRATASATAFARRSWFVGFNVRVTDRIQEAERGAVEQAAPGTALVLADRSAEVTALKDELFPELATLRKRTLDAAAYGQGSAAGSRADIGQKRVENSRVAIG